VWWVLHEKVQLPPLVEIEPPLVLTASAPDLQFDLLLPLL
jgi:hypothetical protein